MNIAIATDGEYRFGVRVREPDQYRHVMRIAAMVYLLAMGIATEANLRLWHEMDHPAYQAAVVIVSWPITAALAALSSKRVPDRWVTAVFRAGAIPTLYASATLEAVSQYAIGYRRLGMQAVLWDVIVVIAFYILSRRQALLLVAFIGVNFAVVMAKSPGVFAPVEQILWLVPLLAAVGLMIGASMADTEQARLAEIAAKNELAALNDNLQQIVADQVKELERANRLRRFLSKPVAQAVLESTDDNPLAAHRGEIAVLFCDMRGFTGYSRQAEPEDVMAILDSYYQAVGEQLTRFDATVGSIDGDGVMAFLNDPYPCDEPARRVAELALAIQRSVGDLNTHWHRLGYDFGAGIGIALGHATLGIIGFDNRSDYTALGSVVNLAARLCSDANAGQILIDARTQRHLGADFTITETYARTLKGFPDPMEAFELCRT